jgi:hypothetical protein
MARLTNEEWTVVKYGNDSYVFMPTAYKARRS